MFEISNKKQEGQALLIVILVIIVALTIGLSLASRGVTNLSTSTEEADSQKALSAAEAGIEKALQNTIPGSGPEVPFGGTSTTYQTDVDPQGDNEFLLNGGSLVTQGEGADVWLAEHRADGTIDYSTIMSPTPKFFHIYWGTAGEICANDPDSSKWPAAIEVIVVWMTNPADPTTIRTTRFAYDPCSTRENNFVLADFGSKTIGGKTFTVKTPQNGANQDLTEKDNIIFMRIVPVYKSTVVGVSTCNHAGNNCGDPLPSQGFQISSTGTAGSASRKINVFKGHQQIFLPYISYGLFVPKKL